MRESDIDWEIYHIIATVDEGCPRSRIIDETLYEDEVIHNSLQRLLSSLLIHECNQVYRVISVQEYMLKCQLKYCQSTSIIIENGIIRVKRPDE